MNDDSSYDPMQLVLDHFTADESQYMLNVIYAHTRKQLMAKYRPIGGDVETQQGSPSHGDF